MSTLYTSGDFSGIVSDRTLTAAEVKALFTTPLAITLTPSAGIINVVDAILFGSTFVSVAYAGANNLEFRYSGAAGVKVTADIAAATLNFTTGTKYGVVKGIITEFVPVPAAAIYICVPVANPTAGDSLVRIRTYYHQVLLP
jgi:hypothetical protein